MKFKLGLGNSYDNVLILSPKLRGYLDISKPASTIGVAGGFFIASLLYFFVEGRPADIPANFTAIALASIAAAMSHGASQAMNMAEDAHIDKQTEHKQNRPIPSGVLTEEEARTVSWIMSAQAIVAGYLVNVTYGTLVVFMLAMGIFYNLSPIRAKERIISIPWQAVSRGLLLIPAVWAAYGNILDPLPWAFGLFMFCYVFGYQNSADIIDRHIDAEFGIQTFVVAFGLDRVIQIAAGSTAFMAAIVLLGWEYGVFPDTFVTLLGIIPFCLAMLWYMHTKPDEVSESTGNHVTWLWFYMGMLGAVLFPLSAEAYVFFS